jgi:16S rRNA (adenine1518-N6/adenine1519-N6)-dimethyltransferase
VRLTPKETRISDEDFNVYSKFTKALFQHRNKKIRNALIDSRHVICDLDKKEMKRRMNEIESDEINEYLKKRVIVLHPEEILFLSKKINSILN